MVNAWGGLAAFRYVAVSYLCQHAGLDRGIIEGRGFYRVWAFLLLFENLKTYCKFLIVFHVVS